MTLSRDLSRDQSNDLAKENIWSHDHIIYLVNFLHLIRTQVKNRIFASWLRWIEQLAERRLKPERGEFRWPEKGRLFGRIFRYLGVSFVILSAQLGLGSPWVAGVSKNCALGQAERWNKTRIGFKVGILCTGQSVPHTSYWLDNAVNKETYILDLGASLVV